MRVQLTRRQASDDSGAVAIVVVLLAVTLFGISAFTLDFGLAYQSKRQLQTAADGAALAGARSLATVPGNCTTIAANSAAITAAQAAADETANANRPGQARVGTLDVRCSTAADGVAANAALVVSYTSTASTKRVFGGIFGSADIPATRGASAAVEPATTSGLRPYGICQAQLTSFNPSAPVPQRFDFPKNSADDVAGCGTASGNWYTLKCPEDKNNASPNLAAKTEFGCTDEAAVVSGQPDPPASADAVLEAACASGPDIDCLGANTGNFPGPVFNAWNSLLSDVVIFPVFSGTSVTGTGTNAKYPVASFVAAKVCGYNFGQNAVQQQWGVSPDPECAGTVVTGTNTENYIWLRPATIFTSGSTTTVLCALGQIGGDCGNDSVRRIRLVR